MTVVVLVVILSLGLVIAACGGSRPEPGVTVEDLTGLWKKSKVAPYLQLNEDGTYRFATAVHSLETAPFEVGQYQLEGTSLTFIASNESFGCKGLQGSYEVELTEEGQLQFVLQEDACEMRGVDLPARPWDRVEP
jgi:hypothetical protein